MSQNDKLKWTELSRKLLFSRYGRKLEEVIFRMPNGQEHDYVIKKEGPVAGVLAITEDNQVILAKQFRPGPQKVLLEMPGGFVEQDDESPESALERELLEETGYTGDIELAGVVFDDAYSTMKRYCFVAKNCKYVQSPATDENEFIQPVTMSLDEFRKLLRSGEMTDVELGYIGLDYLGLL